MPTYEYECLKCGKIKEVFQSINAPYLKKCSECEGELRRLIGSGAGLIFKGSGFYSTDYKRKPSDTSGKGSDEKCPADKAGGCPSGAVCPKAQD